MRRAWLLKFGAVIALITEWIALTGSPRIIAMVSTALVVSSVIAWAICMPSASLFVRSACSFDAEKVGQPNAYALTFDDGPDIEFTPRVLDLLRKHKVHATFFVVGERVDAMPEIVKRIVDDGHSVGAHTFDHSHTFHFRSAAVMRDNIERGRESIRTATGRDSVLFRPPQGLTTPTLADAIGGLQVVPVLWTTRALDAMGRTADRIISRITPALRPGAIIAMHDGGGFGGTTDRTPTLDALARLLEIADARGLRSIALNVAILGQPS